MKSTRFNFGRALLTLCAIFFVSFSFISCQQEDDEKPFNPSDPVAVSQITNLAGTWTSSWGEVYIITDSTFVAQGTYEGNNIRVVKISDNSGYIYIKYTKSFYANGAVKMKQMRAFAEQYLCMDYAMKEVIQYFKSS